MEYKNNTELNWTELKMAPNNVNTYREFKKYQAWP